jgi:hypothetical protein
MPNLVDLHATNLVTAYLDGGTGSMLLQAAIAGFLSVGFLAKTRWNHLKAVVASRFKKNQSSVR